MLIYQKWTTAIYKTAFISMGEWGGGGGGRAQAINLYLEDGRLKVVTEFILRFICYF